MPVARRGGEAPGGSPHGARYAEPVSGCRGNASCRSRPARGRGVAVALALPIAVLGLAGCAPPSSGGSSASSSALSPAPSTAPAPEPSASVSAALVSVIDGDTVETSAGTVRLIGIDTPERGECGHDEASAAISQLLSAGDPITLELPPGQNDRDVHERLLRYVSTASGVDLGLMQVEAGHAVARYDSSDGYPAHPREAAYRAAQLAVLGPGGAVVTTACRAAAEGAAVDEATAERPWWMQYSSCSRLKKNEAGHPTGPFARDDPAQAEIYDWFEHGTGNHGDGDGDGLACE